MAPKTEQELALERTYELARKKKEARLLAKQQKEAAAAGGGGAHAAGPSSAAALVTGRFSGGSAVAAPRMAAPARAAPPAVIPGEDRMERAKRLMAAKAAQSGGTAPAVASGPGRKPTLVTLKVTQPGRAGSSGGGGGGGGGAKPEARHEQRPAADPQQAARAAMAARQVAPVGGGEPRAPSAAAGLRRPAVRRPSTQRVAPRLEAGSKRGRTDDDVGGRAYEDVFEPRHQAATLFVGDLPPVVASEDLLQLFSQFAPVAEVKVIGNQGYAFITFGDPETALRVHHEANQAGVQFQGRLLRVNRAKGDMPSWQRGPTRAAPAGGAALSEHPTIREVRLEAQAQADTVDAAELLALNLRPPPERQLVVYDDI